MLWITAALLLRPRARLLQRLPVQRVEQVLLETGRLAFGQIFDAAIVEAFFEL